jgi:hypothetical protein
LRIDLVASVRAESCSQELLVIREHGRIPITKLLDESRRPLDVREEEGDCATGQLNHAESLIPPRSHRNQ